MTADPAAIPPNTPVDEPIVAINVLLLVHVPPRGTSVADAVVPGQIVNEPKIGPGRGLTVTTAVIEQPPGAVYVIIAVLGELTMRAVTRPVVNATDAIVVGLLLSQVPPVVASESSDVSPEQIRKLPVIGAGAGLTVTTDEVEQVPSE